MTDHPYEIVDPGKMEPSPVPPYGTTVKVPPDLQTPHYFPDILPIYVLKTDPDAAAKMAELAARATPPKPGVMHPANVDDPTSPPVRVPTATGPGAYVAEARAAQDQANAAAAQHANQARAEQPHAQTGQPAPPPAGSKR